MPVKVTTPSLERITSLLAFDRETLAASQQFDSMPVLVGVDEVGRGCLAGPVVAAAVILPVIPPESELAIKLSALNDSKLVTPPVREELSQALQEICQFAVGEASVAEIDSINILNASLLAMRRAVQKLKIKGPALLLIDGNRPVPRAGKRQIPVIKGDGKSASIAAASVIAKVYRDALMCRLAQFHPQYAWQSNKGYGSREHREGLALHGPTPWHRRSFEFNLPEEEE